MDNCVALTSRVMQIVSPLPTDVMPNIMLRVEDRQAFSRLACTCHGFYAWSQPWLKSRQQAAALSADPQRLTKLPAWIKTNSRHLHPADCDAIQQWNNGGEQRLLVDVLKRSVQFNDAALLQQRPAPSATACNAAHLDFVLFSPRLVPDVNEDVHDDATERLRANASFVLAGFTPVGEAWQYDVLAGALAWLKENASKITVKMRFRLLQDLTSAMQSVMVAQRSPALATHLLEHGLVKTHHVLTPLAYWAEKQLLQRSEEFQLSALVQEVNELSQRLEEPLLTALVQAAVERRHEADLTEASAFFGAIGQVVSRLAEIKESPELIVSICDLVELMALTSGMTWIPGAAESAWLYPLLQMLQGLPIALSDVGETLVECNFISPDAWHALLLSVQSSVSQDHG